MLGLVAAPLPPRRDPHTSLSYSKATSKSMSEGLAEIGQCVSRVDTVAFLSELTSCSEASRNGSVRVTCVSCVADIDTCCFLVTTGRANSSEASRDMSACFTCVLCHR